MSLKLLNQVEATNIDLELFQEYKFSVDQLMELAGLSCAQAVNECFPAQYYKNVLICCGPGNNGGDGLVCARHLSMMKYQPVIYYPKRTPNTLYENLLHQCTKIGIACISDCPTLQNEYNLIVDALFGFSFKPPVREMFVPILDFIKNSKIPVASIDIPSGWDVEQGKIDENSVDPELLISLTAPKMCSKYFKGKFHYLGGRFVPKTLEEKYQLNLPEYPKNDMIIKI